MLKLKLLKKLLAVRQQKVPAYLVISVRGRVITLPNGKRIKAKEIIPLGNGFVLIKDIRGKEYIMRI